MIITKKNYDEKLQMLTEKNIDVSEQFLQLFKELKVDKLNMASVGNSASAGYSKCDRILPFLMRSSLYEMSDNINYYSYARVRRNEEINVLRWYNSNISHSVINKLNIDDILVKKHAYVEKYWNGNTIKNYELLAQKNGEGLRDFNLKDNSIIIYNGLTGSFTNAFRKGTTVDKLKSLATFRNDIENAKILFMQMYLDNPNTQIYICGLPNIAGTGIISYLDKYIKKICDEIPNMTYVKGAIRNSFFYLDDQKEFDVHYSQPEYLQLLNDLTESMINNYVAQRFANSLIDEIKNYSSTMEIESTVTNGCDKAVSCIIDEQVEKNIDDLKICGQELEPAVDKVMKYYQRNYLSTFPCTPKEKVLKKLYNTKKIN